MNKTIPTISFFAPHWELVFDGILAIDGYGVKTRNNDRWKHRGLVLCYTSQQDHKGPVRAHKLTDIPRGIVGCALLKDLRALSDVESRKLYCGYNNIANNARSIVEAIGNKDAIYPMDYGYFMKPVYRFAEPFIPPKQHMFGPIGRMPLYSQIEKQLPKWAVREIGQTA